MRTFVTLTVLLLSIAISRSGEKQVAPISRAELQADGIWQLDVSNANFDASGLLWRQGKLLLVGDHGPIIYEVVFGPATNRADVKEFSRCFETAFRGKAFDCEGVAQDDQGRLLLVNESGRNVYRSSADLSSFEQLHLDFGEARKFFSPDKNASFEGITFGGGRLYLANEREQERILVLDPVTGKLISHFARQPSNKNMFWHYSDLSWQGGHLFVLLRHARVILELDPATEKVVAEYDFRKVEALPEVEYKSVFGTGTMEGLAVTDEAFWLVSDNNGQGRKKFPKDKRPTLVRCPRPASP